MSGINRPIWGGGARDKLSPYGSANAYENARLLQKFGGLDRMDRFRFRAVQLEILYIYTVYCILEVYVRMRRPRRVVRWSQSHYAWARPIVYDGF